MAYATLIRVPYRLRYQEIPYTVFACDEDGLVTEMVKAVADTALTHGYRAPDPAVPAEMTTTGVAGSVALNVTVTRAPVAAPEPVPQVRLPRAMVDPAATTGAGGEVPAFAAAAAVTVVESQGE
jgi:hypothetical protein